ncbi:MAG: hypothetical protein ACLP9L_29000 [Thermoguttaceae bacterium]
MSTEPVEPESGTTSVEISFDRPLPLVCALCGQAGKHGVMMSFAESGLGLRMIWAAALFGFLPLGLAAAMFAGERDDKIHPVRIPLCHHHRRFRRGHTARLFGMVVIPLLLMINIYVLIARQTSALPLISLLVLVLLWIWSIHGLVKDNAIRGESVTRHRMVLEGVAPAFAKSVEARVQNETSRVESFLDGLQ